MSKKPIILPKLPSALIRIAVADLVKVLAQPDKYVVDMGTWHAPTYNSKKCSVCFAGSVMAGTLGLSPKKKDDPIDGGVSELNGPQLMALNDFRNGAIRSGLDRLGVSWTKYYSYYGDHDWCEDGPWKRGKVPHNIDTPYFYTETPGPFIKAMIKLADRLEKRGL